MEPSTLNNLTTFANRYERIGTYRLMPADMNLNTGEYKVQSGTSDPKTAEQNLPSVANRRTRPRRSRHFS